MIILCGGELLQIFNSQKHSHFIDSILLNKNILIYPFAQDSFDLKNLLLKIKTTSINQIDINKIVLASDCINARKKQLHYCDLVIILGGSEIRLQKYITKKELLEIIKTKIIIASSAGSNIFAQIYYSNDRNQIEKGLSILPISLICHYSSKKIANFLKLIEADTTIQSISLKEAEFYITFLQTTK